MGDRFYQQQLEALGTCPGYKGNTKRKKRMAWDQDKKDAVVAAYEEQNPTPETSMEIVKEIADDFGESPNGVRMVLSKAGVYVKKTPASGSGASSSSGGGTRVNKSAIKDAGADVDEDVISKLTGKAAQYFAGVIISLNN